MKNNKTQTQRKDILISEETGLCYKLKIRKEKDETIVDVVGMADNTDFSFAFKERKNLIRLVAKMIIEKERLEKKIKYVISENSYKTLNGIQSNVANKNSLKIKNR